MDPPPYKLENAPPPFSASVWGGLLQKCWSAPSRRTLAAASAYSLRKNHRTTGLPGVEDASLWNEMIALVFPWLHWPWEHLRPRVSKPSRRCWHSGGLDTLFLSGRSLLSTGGIPRRGPRAAAHELHRPGCALQTWASRAAPSRYPALPSRTRVSLCVSRFQLLLVRKDHCFGRRNLFFLVQKQQLYKRLKTWTLWQTFFTLEFLNSWLSNDSIFTK